jgi:hypothetical protein
VPHPRFLLSGGFGQFTISSFAVALAEFYALYAWLKRHSGFFRVFFGTAQMYN